MVMAGVILVTECRVRGGCDGNVRTSSSLYTAVEHLATYQMVERTNLSVVLGQQHQEVGRTEASTPFLEVQGAARRERGLERPAFQALPADAGQEQDRHPARDSRPARSYRYRKYSSASMLAGDAVVDLVLRGSWGR